MSADTKDDAAVRAEIARLYFAMEKDLDAFLNGWQARLQAAGWTETFGFRVRESLRDDLFWAVLDCTEFGGDALAAAIEAKDMP